jgi:hypothetical protein
LLYNLCFSLGTEGHSTSSIPLSRRGWTPCVTGTRTRRYDPYKPPAHPISSSLPPSSAIRSTEAEFIANLYYSLHGGFNSFPGVAHRPSPPSSLSACSPDPRSCHLQSYDFH